MSRFLLVVLAVLLAASPSFAQLSDSKLHSLLDEANTLFRQGNDLYTTNPAGAVDYYRRAALRYERIIHDGGIENGQLYYNIGNAYFRSGDTGRAILNYLRAERFIPGDENLEANLAYARSRRQDTFEEPQRAQVLQTLLFFHYDLSRAVRFALLAIFSALFWGLATLRLLRKGGIPRWALVVTAIPAVLFLGSLATEAALAAGQQPGVVLAEQVVARKGDGESYEPSFVEPLHAGTEFVLMEARSGWDHIQLPDGRECWIPDSSAGLVSQ